MAPFTTQTTKGCRSRRWRIYRSIKAAVHSTVSSPSNMAPQRTSRRLASTYHRFPETLNVSPRRHPMLLRSMATPTDSSHSIVLETSGSLPALESTTNCSADPQSDSSLSPLHSLSELPSKPVVPVELLATTDGNIIRNMEMFCTRSQRLYNEQEGSLKYTKKCINLAEQQCAVSVIISYW